MNRLDYAFTLLLAAALALPPASEAREDRRERRSTTFPAPFLVKNRHDLSAEQRRKLMRYGRQRCEALLYGSGSGYIIRITILSDGRVRCFYST